MKRMVLAGVTVLATTLTAGAFYARRGSGSADVLSIAVTRGDIVEIVAATGTLER